MPFLGERHQFWVNDIKRVRLNKLTLKDRLAVVLLALLLLTFSLVEFSPYWTSSEPIKQSAWLYLNATTEQPPDVEDRGWSNEHSNTSPYWIKAEVSLKVSNLFDALQVSSPSDYILYWDGYLIGEGNRYVNEGVTQIHLLDKHHLLEGRHHVMLRVDPGNTFLDLSRKRLLLGWGNQLRMMAIMKLFLLIGTLGLIGLIVLLFLPHLKSFKKYPRNTVWFFAIFSVYLGLSLVNSLHHQPFIWGNTLLPAVATACALQLIYAISRHIPNLLFKSFFSIAAATYVLIYFILGNQNERLILYFVALLLTVFFLFYTTSNRPSASLWSLVAVLPFVSPLPGTGFVLLAFPLAGILIDQLFTRKAEVQTPKIPIRPHVRPANYLLVNSKSDKKSIPLEDVAMIKAANNYSIIILRSGATFLHDKSLLKLSNELPNHFKRIHKSFVVNFNQVEQVKNKPGGGKLLALINGEEVPVGRAYHKELAINFA